MIWDCFTFLNELDVLEIRLNELEPVVDRFVLVEATRTFSGDPKPLVFAEHQERFARFLPKLTHVVVGDLPVHATTWAREAFQRDAILRGLEGAEPDDVVLIGDVDEIPRAAAVRQLVETAEEALVLYMPLFYVKLNLKNVAGAAHDPLTVAIRRSLLTTAQEIRRERFALPGVANAGWHFSFLGDETSVRRKIEAYSHQELNRPEFTEESNVRERLEAARDLFDRPGFAWKYVPLDDTFPRFVLENRAKFDRFVRSG